MKKLSTKRNSRDIPIKCNMKLLFEFWFEQFLKMDLWCNRWKLNTDKIFDNIWEWLKIFKWGIDILVTLTKKNAYSLEIDAEIITDKMVQYSGLASKQFIGTEERTWAGDKVGWWVHKLHKHYFSLFLHIFPFFHNKQRKEEKPNKMKSPEVSPGTWCSAGLTLFWGPPMQSE